MMVGLRNFHGRREVVPDNNFWCGCPAPVKQDTEKVQKNLLLLSPHSNRQ